MFSIMHVGDKVKGISDNRERKSRYRVHNSVMGTLLGLLMQVESLNSMLEDPTRLSRIQKALGEALPKIDALRSHLSGADPQEIKGVNDGVVEDASTLGTFDRGTIDGELVMGLDGTENYVSKVKICDRCHYRSRRGDGGEPEMHHRIVVASTVGPDLGMCVIIDSEPLAPHGPSSKAQGETTAAKKIIPRIPLLLGRPADYLTMDALYLKTPVLDAAREAGMHAIVRLKGDNLKILGEAKEIFEAGGGRRGDLDFTHKQDGGKTWRVEVWMAGNMEFAKYGELAVFRFDAQAPNGACETMHIACTDMEASAKFVWKCAHYRWDIELSAIKMLKGQFHFDHCFCHGAFDQICQLNILAFNLRALFFGFWMPKLKKGLTWKAITNIMLDEILLMRKQPEGMKEFMEDG